MFSPTRVAAPPPKTAVWLGGLGVIPFAALTVVAWTADEEKASTALFAVVAYGAVILSFLGGSHWGLASRDRGDQSASASRLMMFSVVPSLVGRVGLLVPMPWSLVILAIAFAAVLPLHRWAMRVSLAPDWWLRLRTPLSATLSLLLAVAFLSSLVRFAQ